MTPWFFGYGSLVNCATHDYPQAQTATLNGWRRVWVRTALRDVVFLSIHHAPGHSIDGLVAAVPDADWAALDLREGGYARLEATRDVTHTSRATHIAAYQVPPSAILTWWSRGFCGSSERRAPKASLPQQTAGTRRCAMTAPHRSIPEPKC